MNQAARRVVVTGLGVVSSIGLSVEEFWRNLLSGKSGISEIESVDLTPNEQGYSLGKFGGEIKNFKFADAFPEMLGPYPRSAQMALSASKQALDDSRIAYGEPNFRVGVAFGTTMGEAQVVSEVGEAISTAGFASIPAHLGEFYFAPIINNLVGATFKLYGPNIMLTNACAAGSVALSYGFEKIKAGHVDAMVVGGADAFSRTALGGFTRMGAVADGLPKPFDVNRTGMIVAEGAGALVIESLEHARARGARIYSEVLNYGISCDAHHITRLHLPGLVHGLRQAFKMSGLEPKDISYISVHGTGTQANDQTEASALYEVFGDLLRKIPISSIKSMLGHSMGAASALECVSSNMALRNQYLPPTANFETIDPEIGIELDVVPNVGRPHKVEAVLKTASAFGGNNCILIFRRFTD